jgi:hypothetical protein
VKSLSPQLGFNNNVKHKGRVFHIQTEDSGIRRPHVITHLFADGGRILKTTKTSYAEHVENANVTETVTRLMKEQHKAMFVALRDGQFDHLFDGGTSGATPSIKPPAPDPVATQPAFFATAPSEAPPSPQAAAAPQVVATAARTAATMPDLRVPATPSLDRALDLATLERAAATAQAPYRHPSHGLPPPPAAAVGHRPRVVDGLHSAVRENPTEPERKSRIDAPPLAPRAPTPAPSAGRYAISRPASIFASTRPPEGASIFGEELISEKSLDEVILSYLADDLDGPPAKK